MNPINIFTLLVQIEMFQVLAQDEVVLTWGHDTDETGRLRSC